MSDTATAVELQLDVAQLVFQNGDWILHGISARLDGHVVLAPVTVDVHARERSVLVSAVQLTLAPGWLRAALHTTAVLSYEFAEERRRLAVRDAVAVQHEASRAEWQVRCPSVSLDALADGVAVASICLLHVQVALLATHVTGSIASLSVRPRNGDVVLAESFSVDGAAAVTFDSRSVARSAPSDMPLHSQLGASSATD